jgi:hypothetical protein
MRNAFLLSLLALGAVVSQAQADCCPGCGCHVHKRCRLICETKQVTTFEYNCECEDFCLPGRSCHCGTKCVPDCNTWCGFRKEVIWKPSCGPIKTRTYLTKVPVVKEVPSYRCVVECVCSRCGQASIDGKATQAAQQYVDQLPEAELKKLGELATTEADGSKSVPLGVVPTSAEVAEEPSAEHPAPSQPAAPLGILRFFKR